MKKKITLEQVRSILKNFPDCRNSDLELGNRLCQVYDIYLPGADWMYLANSISRKRRKIQQGGEYLATSPVEKRRKKMKENCIQEYIASKKEIQEKSINKVFAG